jgi:steroid delta-isomerase-like uncharacterized protein
MTPLNLVRAFYDRIWNAGDMDATEELLAPDFRCRGSLGPELRGRQAFCDYVRAVRSALEDYRCEIMECVTEDQKAFAKMRFSGTHMGSLRGFPPSGKRVEWLAAALFRVNGPLIEELWVLGDLDSLDARLRENAETSLRERGRRSASPPAPLPEGEGGVVRS